MMSWAGSLKSRLAVITITKAAKTVKHFSPSLISKLKPEYLLFAPYKSKQIIAMVKF